MFSRAARLVAVFVVGAITACGGGGDASGPPVVTTVEISPNPVTLFMGDTVQLTATVRDQNGTAMAAQQVIWSSDATAVATIDTTGKVVAIASGTARITAAVDGKSGSVSLTSTGPGTTGAVTGSATVGTTGGTVQAVLPGGGTLGLTIPPGALRSTVTVTLEPVVPPPGVLASFRLTPAGTSFDKDATLVIRMSAGAKLRSTSTLVIEQDGQRIPIPGVRNLADGTITVSLSALGLRSDSAAGMISARTGARTANAGGSGSGTGNVLNAELDVLFNLALMALDALVARGTIATAENVQQAMEAITTLDASAASGQTFEQMKRTWETAVCQNANFAFNALANFNFVSDYRGLERVFVNVIHWHRIAKDVDTFMRQNASFPFLCFNGLPNPQTRIRTRLTTLEPSIVADLNAFALEPTPRDSSFFADRLKPLTDIGATLITAGFDPEALIVNDIVTGQLKRLRAAGYARCVSSPGNQELQARLARNLVFGALPGLALSDVQEDIEFCGMIIQWSVLDTAGTRKDFGTVGGGIQPAETIRNASTQLIGNGTLQLNSGHLQALLCPSPASANNEQLEIVAGRNTTSLTRVAVLSPSNQNRYLAVSPLNIGTDTLRKVAGLAPNDSGLVTVVVRRIGGVCSGLFTFTSHSTLATIRLTLLKEPPVIYFKDFNTGAAGPEWSIAQLTTSPSGQRFLGELGNSSTTLTLSSLPEHTQLILDVDLYIIDSWNGNGGTGSASAPDIVEISVVGGPMLKRTTFSNKPSDVQAFPGDFPGGVNPAGAGALGKSTLGYDQDRDHFGDSSYRLRLTFNHTGGSIVIRFASQQTSGQNERWGIDNVRLTRGQ